MKRLMLCLAIMCLALTSCEKEKSYKYSVTSYVYDDIRINEYDASGNVIGTKTLDASSENYKGVFMSEVGAASVGIPSQRVYDHGYINLGSGERYKLKDSPALALTIHLNGNVTAY